MAQSKEILGLSIDCEFTGFDMMGCDLLSIGAVEIYKDLTLGREFQAYLRPESSKYFTDDSVKVHGISYFKALTFPNRRESLIAFMHWLKPLMNSFKLKTLFWGSWGFDLRWIETTMRKEDLVDSFYKAFDTENNINVYSLAKDKLKHIDSEDGEKGKYKLSNVARYYDIDLNHHEALSDARACAQIYIKLMNNEKTWTGELF